MAVTEKITSGTQAIVIDDCWNRIGVWGRERPRCPKLDSVIHCMNCQVYSGAGRQLLDRVPHQDYIAGWTEQLKQEKSRKYGNLVSAVVFRIAGEWLALSARLFQEVVEMRVVHRVPHGKTSVLRGLINIRGELQLCVSMGQLLGIEKRPQSGPNPQVGMGERMVVVAHQGDRYVFPVTEIQGICRYANNDLEAVPTTAGQAMNNYLKGILNRDGRHVGCLDEELIFSSLKRVLG
jgi:chemotaxis-related protein WspD